MEKLTSDQIGSLDRACPALAAATLGTRLAGIETVADPEGYFAGAKSLNINDVLEYIGSQL